MNNSFGVTHTSLVNLMSHSILLDETATVFTIISKKENVYESESRSDNEPKNAYKNYSNQFYTDRL